MLVLLNFNLGMVDVPALFYTCGNAVIKYLHISVWVLVHNMLVNVYSALSEHTSSIARELLICQLYCGAILLMKGSVCEAGYPSSMCISISRIEPPLGIQKLAVPGM